MESTTWVYYRLFQQNPDDFAHFVGLLNEVISPVIEEFELHISHFHFLYYRNVYKEELEGKRQDGVEERLPGVSDNERVGFIRLRILVSDEEAQRLHARIRALMDEANARGIARGYELPSTPYNPDGDLGDRFGHTRTHLVMDLLHAAARLSLNFAQTGAQEPVFGRGDGGPNGLVHLVANTTRYGLAGYATQIRIVALLDSWDQRINIEGSPL